MYVLCQHLNESLIL